MENEDQKDIEFNKIVEAQVAERLAAIKGKLDSAYSARDDAIKEATRMKQEAQARELEALEKAGKHQEVLQMKLAAAEEKLKMADEAITSFRRDSVVKESLRGIKFRNDRAADMAYKSVVEQLVQDKDGSWVHKTGTPIKDFISAFSKDEDNSFLFEAKPNSGANTNNGASQMPDYGAGNKRKITELSAQEVLQLAQAGKLGSFMM